MRGVIGFLLGAALIGAFAADQGWVASPTDAVEWLANRPEVTNRFGDPASGRFDATVFLFTCIILTPIAGLSLALVAAIMMMTLEGTVFQVSRRLGMPDGLTVMVVTVAVGGLLWSQTDLWLPRSLRLLGTIARAWVISTT